MERNSKTHNEANANIDYYDFDDLVFLVLNGLDPDTIVAYGYTFDDYMNEQLGEEGVRSDSLVYKAIDFDKQYEIPSQGMNEIDLPSGKKAWLM